MLRDEAGEGSTGIWKAPEYHWTSISSSTKWDEQCLPVYEIKKDNNEYVSTWDG